MPPLNPIAPSGVFTAYLYPTQVSAGPGISALLAGAPGDVNQPIFFEPPPPLSGGQLLLWIIVSGSSPNWGGCQIWPSVDNTTYPASIGTVLQGQIQGLLTATFPSGTDPDTSNTLSVDLTESLSTMSAATQQDADDFLSLCYCDGELIAYTGTTMTAPNQYSLDTYIRRGLYGTPIGSHASGSQFAELIASTFSQQFPANFVGRTFWFKFPSFNKFMGGAEQLSAAVAYPYTFTGRGLQNTFKLRQIPQGSTTTLSTINDYIIEVVTGTLAQTTVNGPTTGVAAGIPGPRFELHDKNYNAGTYNINFIPAAGQTVEGNSQYGLNISNGTAVLTWDGVEWSASAWSN